MLRALRLYFRYGIAILLLLLLFYSAWQQSAIFRYVLPYFFDSFTIVGLVSCYAQVIIWRTPFPVKIGFVKIRLRLNLASEYWEYLEYVFFPLDIAKSNHCSLILCAEPSNRGVAGRREGNDEKNAPNAIFPRERNTLKMICS